MRTKEIYQKVARKMAEMHSISVCETNGIIASWDQTINAHSLITSMFGLTVS